MNDDDKMDALEAMLDAETDEGSSSFASSCSPAGRGASDVRSVKDVAEEIVTSIARSELVRQTQVARVIEILNRSSLGVPPAELLPITLRDWLAGQAINGFAACGQVKVEMNDNGPFGNITSWAYKLADAMIEARQKDSASNSNQSR